MLTRERITGTLTATRDNAKPMKKKCLKYSMPGWLVLAVLVTASPAQVDIYSWTDENGVRHYSDTPPDTAGSVAVTPAIPHDREADEKSQEAHQEMMRQVEAERVASEQQELEKRLSRTEKKLDAAERKAAQALDKANEARDIAEEKQRRREVYVLPWIGPHKKGGVRHKPRRLYEPYSSPGRDMVSGHE